MLLFKQPPDFWDKKCSLNKSFFHNSQWHSILEKGFNAKTIYMG